MLPSLFRENRPCSSRRNPALLLLLLGGGPILLGESLVRNREARKGVEGASDDGEENQGSENNHEDA